MYAKGDSRGEKFLCCRHVYLLSKHRIYVATHCKIQNINNEILSLCRLQIITSKTGVVYFFCISEAMNGSCFFTCQI